MGDMKPYRHNHEHPVDALLTAIEYLRDGRNVRLNDAAVKALSEEPDFLAMTAKLTAMKAAFH
jgi:hypothetical protein